MTHSGTETQRKQPNKEDREEQRRWKGEEGFLLPSFLGCLLCVWVPLWFIA
jgi:hypothetical protein